MAQSLCPSGYEANAIARVAVRAESDSVFVPAVFQAVVLDGGVYPVPWEAEDVVGATRVGADEHSGPVKAGSGEDGRVGVF